MIDKILKWVLVLLFLSTAAYFSLKIGGPKFLQNYVKAGVGDCASIPILCRVPEGEINVTDVDKDYIRDCIPYKFPRTAICVPKGFKVVQELIKKPYYIKRKPRNGEPIIYLLHQGPAYFCKMYPQIQKTGITSNSIFLHKVMFAQVNRINNINDAFFVIMKGIFTPDVGNQYKVKITQFKLNDLNGYIIYGINGKNNYYDCSIINKDDDFFKVYIKDIRGELDLDKVFAIISTISNGAQNT
jgi:hypothetical protein